MIGEFEVDEETGDDGTHILIFPIANKESFTYAKMINEEFNAFINEELRTLAFAGQIFNSFYHKSDIFNNNTEKEIIN